MSIAIVFPVILAVILIVGSLLFALSHKESGYAIFGMLFMVLLLIGILIFKLW
jgi:hypothetical protein